MQDPGRRRPGAGAAREADAMNAPMISEVTAATGTPTPIATPALIALGGVPRAAEVRPAPSSARTGRLKGAAIKPKERAEARVHLDVERPTAMANTSSGPKMRADAAAPRRAARIATRRLPVGSGRQFGSRNPIHRA